MTVQQCISCRTEYGLAENLYRCRACGDLLEIKLDLRAIRSFKAELQRNLAKLSVWRYRRLLPVRSKNPVTLREGGTYLHKSARLAAQHRITNLYFKNEAENPTGSFKDRGMTVGITRALELKATSVLCASTGNTSASLAAYAARAGLRCLVYMPVGKVAPGKLTQAVVHGAQIMQVQGNFDRALQLVIQRAMERQDSYLLNSVNPFRIEGQKTLAFEIVEQLNFRPPSKVIVPVGNAGNISAIWKGFTEFHALGLLSEPPQMIGVQAAGAAPIARAIRQGKDTIRAVKNPDTVASAIRIGAPASWKKALKAIRESHGTALIVSDDEILVAQRELASKEGLFVEPASAASWAGCKQLVNRGAIDRDEVVVCVTTGTGLKDPDIVLKTVPAPKVVSADVDINTLFQNVGQSWLQAIQWYVVKSHALPFIFPSFR